MAAQHIVVPPSKHTIFIRGFSSRIPADNIKSFFENETRETASLEFFRESEDKKNLYVALRFESKSAAKDALDRFNGKEVLGSFIKITFFRDMKKARQKAQEMYEQGEGPDPREIFKSGGQRQTRGRGIGFPPRNHSRTRVNHGHDAARRGYNENYYTKHDRYSSSRSMSASYSRSRSYSPKHSRTNSFSEYSPVPEKREKKMHPESKEGHLKSKTDVGKSKTYNQYTYDEEEDGEYASADNRQNYDDDMEGYASDYNRKGSQSKSVIELGVSGTNGAVKQEKKRRIEGTDDLDELFSFRPEKLAKVQKKKDEIEKSFKQDCETFAAVVKMLISKDESLEEKLQNSLKENLREIGQRCIQELKEYIENLKEE
ncbi:DgyrCDS698 [Dimorphilus gyrociliatus]|uniref:DgyrCDS698 n=1 Tax=Dimorphilus gyrociliatus TaxID=2664684 RepID=A0A7I8V779_9ANNE|nr:DgyrCDS698 [Dimorphilus gyrociliatus]